MKTLTIALALILSACMDVSAPAGLEDYVTDILADQEPARLACTPSLEIAIEEIGSCSVYNANGTLIEFGGFSPVLWDSSDDSIVGVDTTGRIFVLEHFTPGTATITVTGPNGSKSDPYEVVAF